MDLYSQKSRWKIYLALFGLVILGISVIYTDYLARRLAEGEESKAALLVQAYQSIADTTAVDVDLTFQLEIMKANEDIPVVAVDPVSDQIAFATNFGLKEDTDTAFLRKQIAWIKANGPEPIVVPDAQVVYYRQSKTLRLLKFFPFIQFLLIGAFVIAGYLAFSAARRGEQNRVWVGMAKETAHQLGTPISAIIAWIEHLKISKGDDAEVAPILIELDKDVNRLQLIADRFSKIGSAPELVDVNLYTVLDDCRSYMQPRAPRKVQFVFPDPHTRPEVHVRMNVHLFEWVVENLLRNALDAMDGQGVIAVTVHDHVSHVDIDLKDSGKGIPPGKFKTVFKPGFSTKPRGWGLGLSLAKRIIESYHSGKIYVKASSSQDGTTFTIKLPKKS